MYSFNTLFVSFKGGKKPTFENKELKVEKKISESKTYLFDNMK